MERLGIGLLWTLLNCQWVKAYATSHPEAVQLILENTASKQIFLLETWCNYCMSFPSCTTLSHGDIPTWVCSGTELYVLHPIVNLYLEERLKVMTNDIPICWWKKIKRFITRFLRLKKKKQKKTRQCQTQKRSRGKMEMIRGMWGSFFTSKLTRIVQICSWWKLA